MTQDQEERIGKIHETIEMIDKTLKDAEKLHLKATLKKSKLKEELYELESIIKQGDI